MHTGAPDAATARDLVARTAEADGFEALSEQFLLGLDDARLGHRHLTVTRDGALVGLAAADGESAELVVDPDARRAGVGRALVAKLGPIPLWAHGDLEPARAFARELGYGAQRELLVLAVAGETLSDAASVSFSAPGVAEVGREGFLALDLAESERRFGRDAVLDAWLKANNEAFSWHPEQGSWDRERLERAMEAEWFEAGDVWLLWGGGDSVTAAGDKGIAAGDKGIAAGDKGIAAGDKGTEVSVPPLAGFHWTKWHGGPAGEAVGEVYVIGLASDFRGRRLGDPLLEVGLEHLVRRGADRVILYVEADNEAAVKAYRRRGFTEAERHVVYGPAE
ncbi:GNAT family N-acetyltransferase [Corynebacterium sp. MSK006]|nr:GNAT family N-acetyltransferase [Corynebacterium sp. MSK006]MDK8895688.1 GNAT family N-acetyltransferase [Corynebacterium sp. MSK006]